MSSESTLIELANSMADNARDNGYPHAVEALQDFVEQAKEQELFCEDDSLPITTEWVESSFPQGDREGWYVIECDSMVYFEIDSHGEDCFGWWIGGCEWDGARFKTRGDVRRFLWYMQAEMIP